MASSDLVERVQAGAASRPPGASRPGVRASILEAALTEFADKGFQEASLAAIARRLGVTAPLVLYHFGSKANLWREALDVFCGQFAVAVDEAVAEGRTLESREALRLLVRRLVHFFATNRAAYRLMREEGGGGSGQGEWFVSRNLRPVILQIEAVYRRAVAEGAVRDVPFETTFFMILGAVSCYLESRGLAANLFGSGAERAGWMDDYADQVVALCFEGLTATIPRRVPARTTRSRTVSNTTHAEAALG